MTDVVEQPLQNWSGTYRYEADTIHHPRTVSELQALVSEGGSMHALGTRHSFNDVADATELISLAELPGEPRARHGCAHGDRAGPDHGTGSSPSSCNKPVGR